MAYLIDSSILIAQERQLTRQEPRFLATEVAAIAAVTVAELLHGVHRAKLVQQRRDRERRVEAMLSSLRVLPYTEEVARVHSEIWAHLAESGQTIGAHDLMIAATALFHRLTLVTLNRRHFERVPGLLLDNLAR